MKTYIIRKESLKPTKEPTRRVVSFNRQDASILSIMGSYGLSYDAASDFIAKREAEKKASLVELPADIIAAGLLDYKNGENKKMRAYIMRAIIREAAKLHEPMKASPSTIVQLKRIYGL
jgi:hypothetical protein